MAALRELLLNSVKAQRVKFTPTDSISSKNVQGAVEEIDTTISNLTASDITIAQIDSPTYKTLQDWMNTTQSGGVISGGEATDNGNGSITVEAGTGIIKDSADVLSNTSFFDWEKDTNVALTNNSINYVYVNNSSGTVSILSTVDFNSINWANQFIIAIAYRVDTSICIQDIGSRQYNLANRMALREYELRGYERVDGLVLGDKGDGTLSAVMTAGSFYALYEKIPLDAIDTSGTDEICYWYRDSPSGWIVQQTEKTFNNAKYDDGSGILQDLGSGKYNTIWCFLSLDGKLNFVYGRLNTGVLS